MVTLESADLFFVGDGGVAHIGAALEKDVVALYGQTRPEEWHPLSPKVEICHHPHHVNNLCDEAILVALKRKIGEVFLWKRAFVKSSGTPSG